MPIKITMPALSPTMSEGKLAKWNVKEGESVSAGDVIAEIETDKATMEFEAVDEGIIHKIIVPENTAGVAVNSVIAVMREEDESEDIDVDSLLSSGSDAPKPSEKPQSGTEISTEEKSKSKQNAENDKKSSDRVFASPLAKRIAKDKGIDIASVNGSGPRGRIIKKDVESYTGGASKPVPQGTNQVQKPSLTVQSSSEVKAMIDSLDMEYEEIPNSNMRKVIAQRLLESKLTMPHFYLTIECRIDELLKARKRLNDEANGQYKISVNDFVVKALASAIKAYPKINVTWTDDAVLQFKHADISVAVATPDGLITPIVKKAEEKGLKTISSEIKELAKKAREGKLKPSEFQGGTITISNMGMYGVSEFGAIINPPQSCILAVGAGEKKPFIEGDKISVGTFMKCTVSVDHRSVDGATAAEFLQIFKQYIEEPVSMLIMD